MQSIRKLFIILGVPVDDLTMTEALDRLEQFVAIGRSTGRTHQVATINADFVVNALHDADLRRILQKADMATADGMPLVWGARALGIPLADRVTGADMVPALAERAAQKGLSLYFLGAGPGVAARAAELLQERHPGLKITGVVSPPHGAIQEMDPTIIDNINVARPDILLVAFGNPKQEKWIDLYADQLNVPVCIGVGGTLDMIAGVTRRAPRWMQRLGLEWSYRLLQEPRRLWKRYVHDLWYFGRFFVRQWWLMRQGRNIAPVLPRSDVAMVVDQTVIMNVQARMDIRNYADFVARAEQAMAVNPFLIVDLSATEFLDSSAMGALVGLANRARSLGGDVWLVAVPARIVEILATIRLDRFFEILPDAGAALALRRERYQIMPAMPEDDECWQLVKAPRSLDATAATVLLERYSAADGAETRVVLDFSETVFLSNEGLGALIRLDQTLRSKAGELRIVGCSGDILRNIQLMHVDTILAITNESRPSIAA